MDSFSPTAVQKSRHPLKNKSTQSTHALCGLRRTFTAHMTCESTNAVGMVGKENTLCILRTLRSFPLQISLRLFDHFSQPGISGGPILAVLDLNAHRRAISHSLPFGSAEVKFYFKGGPPRIPTWNTFGTLFGGFSGITCHKWILVNRTAGRPETRLVMRFLACLRGIFGGARNGTRTHDLRFTKPLLYQLSYPGGNS